MSQEIKLELITEATDDHGWLKRSLVPVTEFKVMIPILKAMTKVMKDNNGIGLTASQVGLDYRMFVMLLHSDPKDKKQAYTQFVINPVIERVWPKKNINKEGCLSYPGIQVDVTRPIDIMVSFHDGHSKRRMKLNGLDARVFLHEYDHCMGECIVSKLRTLEKESPKQDLTAMEERVRKLKEKVSD